MQRTPSLTALMLVAAGMLGGCAQVQEAVAQPYVGEVQDCSPRIEAVLCRRIAELAVASIQGLPAVAADTAQVSTWDSCENDQVVGMAPAAVEGTACYSVMGSGYAGGERLGNGAYRGGTPIQFEAVVWATADGALRASVTATPLELEPAVP